MIHNSVLTVPYEYWTKKGLNLVLAAVGLIDMCTLQFLSTWKVGTIRIKVYHYLLRNVLKGCVFVGNDKDNEKITEIKLRDINFPKEDFSNRVELDCSFA